MALCPVLVQRDDQLAVLESALMSAHGGEGGLAVLSGRRLARLPLELVRRPYVAFALVYTFAFIYAFSSLGNFGILARERSQLLPVLFVVLCVPRARATAAGLDQRIPERASASQ